MGDARLPRGVGGIGSLLVELSSAGKVFLPAHDLDQLLHGRVSRQTAVVKGQPNADDVEAPVRRVHGRQRRASAIQLAALEELVYVIRLERSLRTHDDGSLTDPKWPGASGPAATHGQVRKGARGSSEQ